MIEYDGEIPVYLEDNIKSFMNRNNCINHYKYFDFFSKYMLKDYSHFLSVRKGELKLKGFFKKLFSVNYAFDNDKDNYKTINNLKKVLKQSDRFYSEEKYNPFKEYGSYSTFESYWLSKSDFNRLKVLWKPYIEYVHNKKMKEEPTYAIQTKVDNF